VIKNWVSISQLYLLFSNRKNFPRRRIPFLIKAIAIKAYVEELSLRRVKNS
jgi:hypothetical protein